MKLWLALLLAAGSSSAQAYELNYGIGAGEDYLGKVQSVWVGNSDALCYTLNWRWDAGAFNDRASAGPAFFISAGLGPRVELGTVRVESFWAVSVISATDYKLGGHLQFQHDIRALLHEHGDHAIGIGWKHISSAGFSMPNAGRNLVHFIWQF